MRSGTEWVEEDLFDGLPKKTSEFESQWQAWVVLARLERVDGLPTDLEPLGEIGL